MRSILLPFLSFLLFISFVGAHAQTPQYAKAIGGDTSSLPFNMTPSWSVQYAFHPQDITGAVSGNITRLWFRSVQANTSVTFNTLVIRMASSDTPQFNVGANGPEMKTDASVPAVLVSSPYTVNSASTPGGWFYIDLQSPFPYSSNKYIYVRFQGEIVSGGFNILSSDYTLSPEKVVVDPGVPPNYFSANWIDMGIDVTPPSTCPPPSNLVVTGNKVTWDPVPGATAYKLEVGAPTPTFIPTVTGAVNATTPYYATGLATGAYSVHVYAKCGSDSSLWSYKNFSTTACDTPTGLAISGITHNSAQMNWDAMPGVTGYECAVTASAVPPSTGATTTDTFYTATMLQPATTYYAHLRSECSPSTYSAWTTVSFTTPVCNAPTGLSVTGITTSGGTLNWTAVAGAIGYECAVTTGATPPANGTAAAGTSYNATGLNYGATYYMHVRTECAAGAYSAWATTSFTTATGSSVMPQYYKGGGTDTCNFAFNDNGVKKMQFVYRQLDIPNLPTGDITRLYFRSAGPNDSATFTNFKITLIESKAWTVPFSSVTTGQEFFTLHRPQVVFNASVYTAYAASIPGGWFYIDLQTPYTFNANHHLVVTLQWDAITAGGFNIMASNMPYEAGYRAQTLTAPLTTDTDCDPDSVWADIGVDVTIPTGVCPPPQNLIATNVTANSADMVWDPVPGATLYKFIRTGPQLAYSDKTGNILSSTMPTYSLTGLTSGMQYVFQVFAVCATDTSLWEIEPVTTLVCDTPTGLLATNITDTSADLSWNASAGAPTYQYAITTNQNTPQSSTTTTDTFFNATGLQPGTSYYLQVRRECTVGGNSIGYSPWQKRSFTTPMCDTPQGLAASGITADSAYLSWNASAGITGFEYAVTTSATPPSSGTATTNNYYASPGLSSGTTYYLHVRKQCTATVFSGWSTISFTTNTQPPGNMSASSVNYTGASLSWGSVPGGIGYQYAVTTSAAPPASGTGITGTSYGATGLTPGTTYYLHVRTEYPGSVFSAWSTISFVTPSCMAATGLASSGVFYTGASLSWNAVAGASGYEYAVTTSATPPASGTATTATTYAATGLTQGTNYYLHVRVQCAVGIYSPWSSTSFTTNTCTAATGLASSGVSYTGANLSWNAVTGASGYQYAVTTSATPPASGTATTATTYAATGLTQGTNYYLHVRVQCAVGVYSPWTSASFTTSTCSLPTGLAISNISHDTADLSWNTVPGATGYEYIVSTSATPPMVGNPTTATTHTATALSASTNYYLHVRTQCVPGIFSAWSTIGFTTAAVPCAAPAAPTITNITTATADISWNTVPFAVDYEYDVSMNATPPSMGTPISATTYSASGLTGNSVYYVHLRTNCGPGNQSPWTTASFTTADTCLAPAAVAGSITDSTAIISWPVTNGAIQYEYSVDQSATPPAGGSLTTANNYTATQLAANTGYYAHLRTLCFNDTSGWATISFTTTNVTSVKYLGNDRVLEIYPNPVNDILAVKLTGFTKVTGILTITDVTGKVVGSVLMTQPQTTIDMSNYAQGVYLIKYADEEHSTIARIVKE